MKKIKCLVGILGILLIGFLISISIIMITHKDSEESLGYGFKYFESPGFIDYWAAGDSSVVFIPPKISSYTNTERYILARQKPMYVDEAIYPMHYTYPLGRDTVYFWFIDKTTKKMAGPLSYSDMEEFLRNASLVYLIKEFK